MARIPSDIIHQIMGSMGGGLDPAELRAFLRQQGGPNNKNVKIGPYDTYVRKGMPRIVDPIAPETTKLHKPLDLANIGRRDLADTPSAMEKQPAENRHKRGKFRELMKLLEDEAVANGRDSVYVEQIFNEFLPEVLDSMGYRPDKLHGMMNPDSPSMYKRLRD